MNTEHRQIVPIHVAVGREGEPPRPPDRIGNWKVISAAAYTSTGPQDPSHAYVYLEHPDDDGIHISVRDHQGDLFRALSKAALLVALLEGKEAEAEVRWGGELVRWDGEPLRFGGSR